MYLPPWVLKGGFLDDCVESVDAETAARFRMIFVSEVISIKFPASKSPSCVFSGKIESLEAAVTA
jgi:hypothetical protein